MADLTFEQLYHDLIEAAHIKTPPPDSFTGRDFARDTGLSESAAQRRLDLMCEAGTLDYVECRSEVDSRATARYYFFVDDAEGLAKC